MQYPSAGDYFSPIQDPERAFRTSSLQRAQLVKDPRLGTPLSASGNSAIVFKAIVDGEPWALRFFTRHDASTREQYTALGRYFRENDLTDYVATSEWVDDAIEVNGRLWPMLRMQWVDGPTLDDYVEYLVEENDTAALASLADTWRSLIARLQAARFAHGDLQHGNVLIDTRGKLRLVDFDGSWIVPFTGRTPPSETGHPNYQRPNRPWGEWMDTFPGLLIYTSLVALSKNTSPWRELYDEDNLLFERTDFDPPHKTPAWNRLTSIADEQLDRLLTQLRQCCAPDWVAEGRLNELLGATPMAPSPPVEPWWGEIGISGHPTGAVVPNTLRPPVVTAPDGGTPKQLAAAAATPARPTGDWWEPTGDPRPPLARDVVTAPNHVQETPSETTDPGKEGPAAEEQSQAQRKTVEDARREELRRRPGYSGSAQRENVRPNTKRRHAPDGASRSGPHHRTQRDPSAVAEARKWSTGPGTGKAAATGRPRRPDARKPSQSSLGTVGFVLRKLIEGVSYGIVALFVVIWELRWILLIIYIFITVVFHGGDPLWPFSDEPRLPPGFHLPPGWKPAG